MAMLVLAIGLLGLLGATANTMRLLAENDRAVTAAYAASERMERLEALGCDAATSGSETRQGSYTLDWTVSGDSTSRARQIYLRITYPLGRGRSRTDIFERAMACLR